MHSSTDPGCYKLPERGPLFARFDPQLVERVWGAVGDCAADVDPVDHTRTVLEMVLRARAAAPRRVSRRVRLVL